MEKANQIPKMSVIYTEAMRVVAFLGEDAVGTIVGDFPSRKGIESLANDDTLLGQILTSTYFSRLWVIQELLLARQVLLAFNGVEYVADPYNNEIVNWRKTSVPWMEELGRRSISRSLLDTLRITHRTKCADGRDKILGIWGLLSENQLKVALPEPDTTLSTLQIMVGFYAHGLLTDPRYTSDMLCNAIGARGWKSQPSWMPDWRLDDSILPNRECHNNCSYLSVWTRKELTDPAPSYELLPELGDEYLGRDSRAFVKYFLVFVGSYEYRACTEDQTYRAISSWFIGTSSGHLSLHVIRLCRFPAPTADFDRVRKIQDRSGAQLFTARIRLGSFSMILVAYSQDVFRDANHSADYIFYPDTKEPYSAVPLVLRQENGPGDYRIVAALHSIWFLFHPGARGPRRLGRYEDGDRILQIAHLANEWQRHQLLRSFPALTEAGEVSDHYLIRSDPVTAKFHNSRTAQALRLQMFPGARRSKDVLPAVYICIRDTNPFDPYYGEETCQEFCDQLLVLSKGTLTSVFPPKRLVRWDIPTFKTMFIKFTFLAGTPGFNEARRTYFEPLFSEAAERERRVEERMFRAFLPTWEWMDEGSGKWVAIDWNTGRPRPRELKVTGPKPGAKEFRVRTKLVKVMECLAGCSWEAEVLKRFTPVTEALGVGELELLEKGPEWIAWELERLGISEGPIGKTELWPRKLVEDYGLSGERELVRIF